MIYAYERSHDKLHVLVASSVSSDDFKSVIDSMRDSGITVNEVDIVDQLMDSEYSKLTTIFTVPSVEMVDAVIQKYDVVVVHFNRAVDKHNDMLTMAAPDPYDGTDTRTVAEITGTDTDDRWDKRSEEEIEEDKRMKEMIDQMRKEGKISDESFAPKSGKTVGVTDIHTSVGADGKVNIDRVVARKIERAESNAVLYVETPSGIQQIKADWEGTSVIVDEDAREILNGDVKSMNIISNSGNVAEVTIDNDQKLVASSENS